MSFRSASLTTVKGTRISEYAPAAYVAKEWAEAVGHRMQKAGDYLSGTLDIHNLRGAAFFADRLNAPEGDTVWYASKDGGRIPQRVSAEEAGPIPWNRKALVIRRKSASEDPCTPLMYSVIYGPDGKPMFLLLTDVPDRNITAQVAIDYDGNA